MKRTRSVDPRSARLTGSRGVRRAGLVVGCLVASLGVGAVAAHAQTITALATGQAKVAPKNPRSEASIKTAVRTATRLAIPRAVLNARAQAALIGQASGLLLGPIESVEQQQSIFTPYFGRFGPNRYCGQVPKRVRVTRGDGSTRLVRRGTRRQCQVPDFATVTVSVTFAAAPAAS
jgi:hypothetical protein